MSPVSMVGSGVAMVEICLATGKALPILLALNLGPKDDPSSEPMIKIILGFPMLVIAVTFLLFTFVFKYRTPKYLFSIGKIDDAEVSLSNIYSPEKVRKLSRDLEKENK